MPPPPATQKLLRDSVTAWPKFKDVPPPGVGGDSGNVLPVAVRVHRGKLKQKEIALAVQRRAQRQTRQKISWSIIHRPEETLDMAWKTLTRQIHRCGKLPQYRAWEKILRLPPEVVARQLLREDTRAQQRNACHPFGNSLAVYEAHHSRGSH